MHKHTLRAITTVVALSGAVLAAEQSPLAALLTDLKGWTAEPATSMSMQAGGDTMTTASRSYRKGDADFVATVVVSKGAYSQAQVAAMSFESAGVKVQVTTIDGFTVQTTYTRDDKSGAIIVVLDKNDTTKHGALLTFAFNGMSDTDALALAKQFDWQKLRGAAQAILTK